PGRSRCQQCGNPARNTFAGSVSVRTALDTPDTFESCRPLLLFRSPSPYRCPCLLWITFPSEPSHHTPSKSVLLVIGLVVCSPPFKVRRVPFAVSSPAPLRVTKAVRLAIIRNPLPVQPLPMPDIASAIAVQLRALLAGMTANESAAV